MIEELESKIHTEDFYDFNKDVETEFPIKDQQEVISVSCYFICNYLKNNDNLINIMCRFQKF